MDTTYIVSGFMRSGTSMMMQALSRGGLVPDFCPSRDGLNIKHGDSDYLPNAHGFYELSREQYQSPDFPSAHSGKLIKALHGRVVNLVPGKYFVIFMLRDSEEIRQSYEAFFSGRRAPLFVRSRSCYLQAMRSAIGILSDRSDCEVCEIDYSSVVFDPMPFFQSLADRGLPIDPVVASSVVDSNLYRFRRERLTLGI